MKSNGSDNGQGVLNRKCKNWIAKIVVYYSIDIIAPYLQYLCHGIGIEILKGLRHIQLRYLMKHIKVIIMMIEMMVVYTVVVVVNVDGSYDDDDDDNDEKEL